MSTPRASLAVAAHVRAKRLRGHSVDEPGAIHRLARTEEEDLDAITETHCGPPQKHFLKRPIRPRLPSVAFRT